MTIQIGTIEKTGEISKKKTLSRTWFLTDEQWIQSCESKTNINPVEIKEKDEKVEIVQIVNLPYNEEQHNCKSCDEEFEYFFDEKREEWMCEDVVEIAGVYYHKRCSTDFLTNPSKYINGESNGHLTTNNDSLKRKSGELPDDLNPHKKLQID